MSELYIGVKFEGADVDIADLEAFFKATKDLNFVSLTDLITRLTKVTITEITVTPVTVSSISESTVYATS